MKLSKNFDSNEFACGCRCGFGFRPGDVDPTLVQALQALRDDLCEPIYLTSGCRCRHHNDAVGGVPNSQHLLGKAADVHGPSIQRLIEAAGRIEAFTNGGIGVYPASGFIHLDVGAMARRWTA